jgi:hypothetical protein
MLLDEYYDPHAREAATSDDDEDVREYARILPTRAIREASPPLRKEATMNHESVQAWLDRYVEAWRTYDPSKIGDLFAEDALYIYNPFDEDDPVRGREAIVANWLEERDAPDSWRARYAPVAVEGNAAVARGRTQYFLKDGTLAREFANVFIMQFDDAGRCLRFTEWYMEAAKERV